MKMRCPWNWNGTQARWPPPSIPNPPPKVHPRVHIELNSVGTIGTRSDTIFGSDGLELTVQSWYPSSDTEGYPHAYGGIFER